MQEREGADISLYFLLACREVGRRGSQHNPRSGAPFSWNSSPEPEGEWKNPHDPGGNGEGAEAFDVGRKGQDGARCSDWRRGGGS